MLRASILPLSCLVFMAGLLLCIAAPVRGEDKPPAVPVTEVQAETLEAPPGLEPPAKEGEKPAAQAEVPQNSDNLVVVELFSSQACVFCPKADALLGELSKTESTLALSCHVDYFDVKTGSLSHPFCSSRQVSYESTLRAGPKYTPQMVIDGRYDVVGYQREDVAKTMKRARKTQPVFKPGIQKDADAQTFTLTLPEAGKTPNASYKIYVLNFDSPHEVKVAEGGNKGKSLTYYNIVSNVGILGDWAGEPKTLRFDPKMKEGVAGFAVLINDQKTGYVVGAAQYLRK